MVAIVGLQAYIPSCTSLLDTTNIFKEGKVIVPGNLVGKAAQVTSWGIEDINDFSNGIGLPTLLEFDPGFFQVTPRDSQIMDPQQRKLLETIYNCFFDAGISPEDAERYGPVGCFVGAGVSNYLEVMAAPQPTHFSESTRHYVGNDLSALALRTAYLLNLTGPAWTVLSTCSSSLLAVQHAFNYVESGEGSFAIAAGAHIDFLTGLYAPEAGGIISPTRRCRPLSAGADGTYFTNGICAILIASNSAISKLLLSPYAQILGAGVSNDGRRKAGYTSPSIAGQASAIRQAYRNANISHRPDVLELHGTGTRIGDPIELQALADAFSDMSPSPVYIGSAKSNFGHLNSTAGLLGLMKLTLSLTNSVCYPTMGCQPLTALFDFEQHNFIPCEELMPLQQDAIGGVSSFGIGGTNVHIVLKGHSASKSTNESSQFFIVLVGSHDEELLIPQLGKIMAIAGMSHVDVSSDRLARTCAHLFKGERFLALAAFLKGSTEPVCLEPLPPVSTSTSTEPKLESSNGTHKSNARHTIVSRLADTLEKIDGANHYAELNYLLDIALGLGGDNCELAPVHGIQKAFRTDRFLITSNVPSSIRSN
ncbi:polyketide synthase [Agrobacterium rhizogenes]|uniref:Beta-ketoacyl synthase, N-terminal domain protein n=2 Tax=Rhizobium rhizogenes TaxID=359 RepID=A0A7S4ZV11_RHIRH|nr:polyketide synthase [Rhizobium rhizogenes]NTF78949.1 polyketide synthase [Rhizobium rhizogenes]NTJ51590.1 polyketide synthase [Rhizobium rhizogenes]QCL10213.1 beta-ketoacyl synthase, N-terminal domain protein [Rhizobium rhizogenes]